jgi:hypothetical protein
MPTDFDLRLVLIRQHFPEYIGGTCLCGAEIADANAWARHLAERMNPVSPTVDRIVDQAKYAYFKISRELADVQYKLAELTGTGKLDPDDNWNLQAHFVDVHQQMTGDVLRLVDTIGDGKPEDTFSDGRKVIIMIRHDDVDAAWPHNEFVMEDGPVAEFPQGVEWSFNPFPTTDS